MGRSVVAGAARPALTGPAAPFRWHLRGRASGVETQVEWSAVYALDDGKIICYREYASREDALAAVGLGE